MAVTKIGLVQMRAGRTMATNVDDCAALIEQAASAGARYVQTPEMSTLIERDRARMVAQVTQSAVDAAVARFSALAAKYAIALHIGSMAVPLADGRFANRAHLFGPDGALITTYDKIHMFDVDLAGGESWRESATYGPGDRCVVAQLDGFTVGLGICYDVRFAPLFRVQAQAGAQLISTPAAFTRQTGQAHWHVLLRARAIETGSYLASAAQGGTHEDGRETYGHSIIIDPWGAVIGEKADDESGVVLADMDTQKVADARAKIPALGHDRAFDLDVVATGAPRAVA